MTHLTDFDGRQFTQHWLSKSKHASITYTTT